MNWFLQRLFLFDKFEIKTSLSKEKIKNKIETFLEIEDEDYYGKIEEDGFWIAERNRKNFLGIGYTRNSLAPVAKAKIKEEEKGSVVSVTIRMNIIVMILFLPIYIVSICVIKSYAILFPALLLILQIAFFMPLKRLKNHLMDIIT